MKSIQNILSVIIVILLSGCAGNPSSNNDQVKTDDMKKSGIKQDTSDRKRPPVYYKPYDPRYSGGGIYALEDDKFGNLNFGDGNWQGYRNNGLDVVIDLGKVQKVTRVSGNFLSNHEGWTFLPQTFIVSTSDDMQEYTIQGKLERETATEFMEPGIHMITIDGFEVMARYIRVKASSIGPAPEWLEQAKGRPTWLFIDEIIIE